MFRRFGREFTAGMQVVASAVGLPTGRRLGNDPSAAIQPTEDRGIVKESGPDVDLGPDLPGYVLRINLATFAPGGVRAYHAHATNPEISYVIRGTITEHRSGGFVQEYGPGTMPSYGRDVGHWLENRGPKEVALVVAAVVKAK